MNRARLVAFFAHPDDEAYCCAGTLALCVRAGVAATVVSATRGEAGCDVHRRVSPGRGLAELRTLELAASCKVVGAQPPRFLDWPDGQLENFSASEALPQLQEILDELEPRTVLTLPADGVYGHCDHVALAMLVGAAMAEWRRDIRLFHADFPRGLFTPVAKALQSLPNSPVPFALDPENLGSPPKDLDLTVDISETRTQKTEAVAAHHSQLPGGDPHRFLQPGLLDKLLEQEWFRLVAGPPLPVGTTLPVELP